MSDVPHGHSSVVKAGFSLPVDVIPNPCGAHHPRIQRVAMVSVHTSPLEQPGRGDAGGMNVYVDAIARRLARRGVGVDVFTRATSSQLAPTVEVEPGYRVRHVLAGPLDGLMKEELPAQLCPFAANVLRAVVPGGFGERAFLPRYDVVHSHYWLSGQVGYLVRDRWGIPLVHSSHTLAKVKNLSLAGDDDAWEPRIREIGEEQVVAEADMVLASTDVEARQLMDLYDASAHRVKIVHPGVDVDLFTPDTAAVHEPSRLARAALGLPQGDVILAFVGRIQPHKGPEVLVRAAAELIAAHPHLPIRALIVGDSSGSGHQEPQRLHALATQLGAADRITFLPAMPAEQLVNVYRAATVVTVPSYSESFGLVAVEAQASGTPVVAAAVGGLPIAVADGASGLLVSGHGTADWAAAIGRIALSPQCRARMSAAARAHAEDFSWEATVDRLLSTYRAARGAPVAATAGA